MMGLYQGYKKQRVDGETRILPPISTRPLTDMNLPLALTCVMTVIWLFSENCETAPEVINDGHRRFRKHPLSQGYKQNVLQGEEDNFLDWNKRQHFDDYGHMRFGKREHFDDYGHMRFGRSHKIDN
ncbi:uncharacterized protein LOC108624620 [Ceratina calcarata]|uniref:Uncharacterized protein LOC108624620 n=1 Tax=Ceratina calcarata TaxID=156304 RepID=A0AAJ7IYH7_9HYME|nr:uncharacterized protein LOC108624620 [Ceratina calcarata]